MKTAMKKTTIQASPDVALVKYWGKKDEVLRLPENGSISLILDGLYTQTTVEFQPDLSADDITINGESEAGEAERVIKHLDRVRKLAGITTKAKVVSQNQFPTGTGLSSSSAGFAALSIAASQAAGLDLSESELSVLARQGSGSACRCVCGGVVEWYDAATSEASFAETIFPPEYWDIRDVVAVVDEGRKRISSSQGHQSARSSKFYEVRLQNVPQTLTEVKAAFAARDFAKLGELVEAEALEFHSILLTSQPSLMAWFPGTVEVMLAVQDLRAQGVPAYFTINTGFNVHVLTLPEHEAQVQKVLSDLSLVKKTIQTKIGGKPRVLNTHLF
jgi:diphosphomevalonate decarboxylase